MNRSTQEPLSALLHLADPPPESTWRRIFVSALDWETVLGLPNLGTYEGTDVLVYQVPRPAGSNGAHPPLTGWLIPITASALLRRGALAITLAEGEPYIDHGPIFACPIRPERKDPPMPTPWLLINADTNLTLGEYSTLAGAKIALHQRERSLSRAGNDVTYTDLHDEGATLTAVRPDGTTAGYRVEKNPDYVAWLATAEVHA